MADGHGGPSLMEGVFSKDWPASRLAGHPAAQIKPDENQSMSGMKAVPGMGPEGCISRTRIMALNVFHKQGNVKWEIAAICD